MKDPIVMAAQAAFSVRLKDSSDVSKNTKNAQAIAKAWRGDVHKLDPERFQIEAMATPELDQKIDVVDSQTACAYEFKVSGKNAWAEFYKDIVKVIIWMKSGRRSCPASCSSQKRNAGGPSLMPRDFGAILTLIRAHALLHQANRQRDSRGRIVATLADYAAVRDLIGEVVSEGVEVTISNFTRETVEAVSELCADGAKDVSVSRVAEHLKVHRATASRRIEVALSKGHLNNLEDRRGKPFRLVVGDPMPEGGDLTS